MKRGLAAELSGQPSPGRCGSSELLPNSIRRWGVVSHGRGWRISKETVITMAAVDCSHADGMGLVARGILSFAKNESDSQGDSVCSCDRHQARRVVGGCPRQAVASL